MAAPQKVSADLVRAAIQEWRGNVRAAAAEVGLSENNLRKRLAAIGIDAHALKRLRTLGPPDGKGGKGVTPITPITPFDPHHPLGSMSPPSHPPTPLAVSHPHGHKTKPAPFRDRGDGPSFHAVEAVERIDEVEPPIPVVRARQQPIRLRPAQETRLRKAVFDLQGRYHVQTSESAILQEVFNIIIDTYVSGKLSDPPKRAAAILISPEQEGELARAGLDPQRAFDEALEARIKNKVTEPER